MEQVKHIPVLLTETIAGLAIKKEGIYVDATLGRGGHSSEILKRLDSGHLYCFDQDQAAIKESRERLLKISNKFTLIESNFSEILARLKELGVDEVDGVLFDLGVSSAQFDEGDRGFSYRYDAKLDMRMNLENSLSAYEIVNDYSLADLTRVIKEYGEEKFAYSIAKKIVNYRQKKMIETTFELVDIIKSALPSKVLSKVGHPAKQTFQALRIEVNDELKALKKGLSGALQIIKKGGRVAVITFNSLEDRIVKNAFNELAQEEKVNRNLPSLPKEINYQLVNKKVITATEEELEFNNRAKPAKLRIIERKG